ncbi:MAG: hypothetical protein ACREGI_04665 [Candidatus Levyibacteriota bacterium]
MINENFVLLGAFFNLIGGWSYFIKTLKGEVKPNKVTWFLWALAPLIAFTAEIKQGVGLQSLLTFMVGFNPLIIFLASFVNKKSFWKIHAFDIFCGLFSLAGILGWILTHNGNFAIGFSILADGLASLPTVIKSYKFPETEDYKIFLFAGLSAIITLLTLKIWSFAYFGFPLYILTLSIILVYLLKFKATKK